MKRILLSVVCSVAAVLSIRAQSVAEGIKDIYYEKYKSAKDVLQKAVTSNPSDPDANYWLGQAYINQNDLVGARSVYAKAMTATNQNPLIMVGMGHVELLEGKPADARAHFDAALAATNNKKGGDVKILTAVGRANADGDSKTGDPNYGIDKLNTAAKLSPTDPDIQILLGISQLKRGPEYGGAAKQAFDAALAIDPKNARAKLRNAFIFLSQKNTAIFLPLMEESVSIDPNYAPGYLALYDYYSLRDVNKAKTYLDQFVAKADKDCNNDIYLADYLFRAGQRDASLAKAKEIETNCPADSFPTLNKLYALLYDRGGDSLQGRSYMEKYIAKQIPSKLTADDYSMMTGIYAKFPEDSNQVVATLDKALALDTSVNSQLAILQGLAATFNAQQNYTGEYNVRRKSISIRPDTTAINFYNYLNAAINSMHYLNADTLAQAYIQQYPTQAQGYYFRTKATILNDADTSNGTAIPAIEQYIQFLKQDTAKNKSRILTYYSYEIYYYANKMKDYQKALNVTDSILSVEPGNPYAIQVKGQLQKALNPPRSNTPASPAKKATTPATKPKTTGRAR